MRVSEILAIAACVALSATAAPSASAQTLWLRCEITSSSGNWANSNRWSPSEHFAVGEAAIFAIGERNWGRWSSSAGRLEGDFCSWLQMEDSHCDFAPTYFRARMSNEFGSWTITINRSNGQFTAVSSGQSGVNGWGSAVGTCAPTTEPAAPQTQF